MFESEILLQPKVTRRLFVGILTVCWVHPFFYDCTSPEQCAGEQDWYSDSGSVKHQEGISTFSMGALIVAEKLDSTKVLSSMFSSPANRHVMGTAIRRLPSVETLGRIRLQSCLLSCVALCSAGLLPKETFSERSEPRADLLRE